MARSLLMAAEDGFCKGKPYLHGEVTQAVASITLGNSLEGELTEIPPDTDGLLWSSIFVTLMANKIGGLQFGIYRNCQISSRVFHTAVAALPLTKANRSDFE